MSFLKSTDNRYGGTYVASEFLPESKSQFAALLSESLKIWQNHQIKVVWIQLPITKSDYLPIVYKAGFVNHHCDANFVVVALKLDAEAVIPSFANHTIGVGGLVINDKNELLTIREKAHIKTYPNNWKFPGGMLDPMEHIERGVIREVLEETNIETQFESFIGFRHHHKGQFGTSNIYAVCKLKPLTSIITIQESEIADARWFPVDDYLADEKIGTYNKQILRTALNCAGLKRIKIADYMSSSTDYEVFMPSM